MDGIALLRVVTIAYAIVLVLTLAATLITITVYLWRIAAVLGGIRRALVQVRERTAPLKQHFAGLEQLTDARVQAFEEAAIAIERSVGIYNKADVFAQAAAKL